MWRDEHERQEHLREMLPRAVRGLPKVGEAGLKATHRFSDQELQECMRVQTWLNRPARGRGTTLQSREQAWREVVAYEQLRCCWTGRLDGTYPR